MNIIKGALDFTFPGGLDEIRRKNIMNEDVFGLNKQNVIGYIPLFNFFIGPQRIEKANYILNSYTNLPASFSRSDKEKKILNHCIAHRIRGVIETIPFVGLLAFIIPDVLYEIIKSAKTLMVSKSEKSSKPLSPIFIAIENMKTHLKTINSLLNLRKVMEYNETEELKWERNIKDAATAYIKELYRYYTIQDEPITPSHLKENEKSTTFDFSEDKEAYLIKKLGYVDTATQLNPQFQNKLEATHKAFFMEGVELPTKKPGNEESFISGHKFAKQIFENLKKNKENIDD